MTIEDFALLFTRGIGSRGAAHLIDYFGSAEALFGASRAELIEGAGLRTELAERILAREGMSLAEREIKYCRKHNIRALAATDEEYPSLLRDTPDRPHVLFVCGDVAALAGSMLSVVGTRAMTPHGQHITTSLVGDLATMVDDLVVVSGLAYGVDAAAHRAALAHGVRTVAVVANALPDVTPAAHRSLADDILRNGGAIVSELHSATRQNGTLFLARNRIIAGLSAATLVAESPASGGSLATADIADSYHRVVLALPGRASDSASFGSNNLIRTGKARLVLTAADVLEDVGWQCSVPTQSCAESEKLQLTDAEGRIYDIISSEQTIDMDTLLARSSMSFGELSMVIMELELKGVIRCLAGRKYEKI